MQSENLSRQQRRARERATEKLKKKRTTARVDLFDNPLIREAMSKMTPEQVEEYKQMGDNMYNTIDYESNEVSDEVIINAAASITEAIKSGLHLNHLTEDEIEVMKSAYGENWRLYFYND
jgi:hypothetical protein